MNYHRKRRILYLLYGGGTVAVLGIVWYAGVVDTSLQPIVSKLVVGFMLLSVLVFGIGTSLTKKIKEDKQNKGKNSHWNHSFYCTTHRSFHQSKYARS